MLWYIYIVVCSPLNKLSLTPPDVSSKWDCWIVLSNINWVVGVGVWKFAVRVKNSFLSWEVSLVMNSTQKLWSMQGVTKPKKKKNSIYWKSNCWAELQINRKPMSRAWPRWEPLWWAALICWHINGQSGGTLLPFRLCCSVEPTVRDWPAVLSHGRNEGTTECLSVFPQHGTQNQKRYCLSREDAWLLPGRTWIRCVSPTPQWHRLARGTIYVIEFFSNSSTTILTL